MAKLKIYRDQITANEIIRAIDNNRSAVNNRYRMIKHITSTNVDLDGSICDMIYAFLDDVTDDSKLMVTIRCRNHRPYYKIIDIESNEM